MGWGGERTFSIWERTVTDSEKTDGAITPFRWEGEEIWWEKKPKHERGGGD